MIRVGRVAELWRFPVKSMAGESLDEAQVGPLGVRGDRQWAVRDDQKARIASAKQIPDLLLCRARYRAAVPSDKFLVPDVEITLPDGRQLGSGEANISHTFSAALGRPLTLLRLQAPFNDYFDDAPLHVLTTTSLRTLQARANLAIDARRFRPNILIASDDGAEGFPELAWSGGTLVIGDVEIAVEKPTVRCIMPSWAQEGFAQLPALTKSVAVHADRQLGVYAKAKTEGTLCLGASVFFHDGQGVLV